MSERRTKRRFAHELYPHPDDGEVRPLSVDVPYSYAQVVGYGVWGTSWFEFDMKNPAEAELAVDRVVELARAREIAFVADALLQGMAGDEAWQWAQECLWDETGEIAYERAVFYGVPVAQIKPYLCGPEPDTHAHSTVPDSHGRSFVEYVDGKEPECDECTEPVEGGGSQ